MTVSRAVRENSAVLYLTIMEITKTDLLKVIDYLEAAASLYDALPMQKCKCRAHMILQLTNKLKAKLKKSING